QLKKLNRLKNQVSEYVSDTKSDILFRDIKEMYAQVDKNSSISDNVYRSNYPSIVKSVMARPNPFLQLKIYGEILEKVKVFGNERRFDYEDLYAVTSFFFERNIKEKDYEKYIDKYMEIYKAFRGENYKLMFQTWTYNEKLSTESLRQIYDRVAAEGFKSAYDAPLTLAIALKGEAHYNTVIEAFRHIEDYERDYNLSVLLSKIFDKDFNIQKLESSMTKVAEVYEQNSEDRRIVSLAVYMEKNNFSPQEVQQGVEVFEQFKSVDSDKPAPLAISYLHFKNIAKKQMRAKGLEAAAIEENFNRIRENEEIDDVDSFFYYYTQAMIWPDNPILWFHPYGLLARVMVGEGLFGTHEMDMAEFTNELVHFDTIRDMDLENASEALREQVLENQELLSEIERPELENSEELEIERPELEISEAPEIEVEAPEIEVEVPEIEVDTSSFDSFDSGD
ncbi:MAG: hypothetical protein VX642_12075, partial [Bdellovibrionota bacterium]|nr:hypothetical protein [Bdellovibrionota bacterium]